MELELARFADAHRTHEGLQGIAQVFARARGHAEGQREGAENPGRNACSHELPACCFMKDDMPRAGSESSLESARQIWKILARGFSGHADAAHLLSFRGKAH